MTNGDARVTVDSLPRCGYVAIVGRPNVGKSTLLNRILGHKLSITSRKPQTTRHQLLGIKTTGAVQALYVDTPGVLKQARRAIARYMNRTALAVLRDVDAIVIVVDRLSFNVDDEYVLDLVRQSGRPTVLAINKVDLIRDKASLLPYLDQMKSRHQFEHMVPISAGNGHNVAVLEQHLVALLPQGPHLYAQDQLTDRNERFLVTEIIREKITRQLGDELPYEHTVLIEAFAEEQQIVHIHAGILVERAGQKKILVGKSGTRIVKIGTEARKDIESLLGKKVNLQLWVKVKSGWSADASSLKEYGYE